MASMVIVAVAVIVVDVEEVAVVVLVLVMFIDNGVLHIVMGILLLLLAD